MRRDVGNEVVVAIVAVAVLAFALTFGILLSLSSRTDTTPTATATIPANRATSVESNVATSVLQDVTVFVPPTVPTGTLSPLQIKMTDIVVQLTQVVKTPPARTATPSDTPAVPTQTPTIAPSPTREPTQIASATPLPPTRQPNATLTFVAQQITTAAVQKSQVAAAPTQTATSTLTNTPNPTATHTSVPPSVTPTNTLTSTATNTATHAPTLTATSTPTATHPPTLTSTPQPTASSTATATATRAPTDTATPTATLVPTFTPTLTRTPTPTATNTATATSTWTATPTATNTPSPTETWTQTPSPTTTPTITPTPLRRGDCIEPNGWALYTVQPGNTLFSIARAVGSSVAELTKANCIANANQLRVGEILFVPHLPESAVQTGVPGSESLLYASGCTRPSAQITRPKVGDHVSGAFAVFGSASIDDFGYYRIEVRSDAATVYQFYAKSQNPVIDGLLGTIDASTFGKGIFWIRVSVVNRAGAIPFDATCAVPLIFD